MIVIQISISFSGEINNYCQLGNANLHFALTLKKDGGNF